MRWDWRHARILLDPAATETGGGGGGGSGTATQTKQDPPPPAPAASKGNDDAGFQAALKRHNDDGISLAREAWRDAETLRGRLTETEGKLPAKGAVVLTAEQVAEWQAFQALGKPAKDVAAALEQGAKDAQTVQAHDRRKHTEKVAKIHGFDPDVLEGLPGYSTLEISVEPEHERGGKKVETALVKTTVKGKDGKDAEKLVPLDEYAKATWPKFLTSLQIPAAGNNPVKGSPIVRPNSAPIVGEDSLQRRPQLRVSLVR